MPNWYKYERFPMVIPHRLSHLEMQQKSNRLQDKEELFSANVSFKCKEPLSLHKLVFTVVLTGPSTAAVGGRVQEREHKCFQVVLSNRVSC